MDATVVLDNLKNKVVDRMDPKAGQCPK